MWCLKIFLEKCYLFLIYSICRVKSEKQPITKLPQVKGERNAKRSRISKLIREKKLLQKLGTKNQLTSKIDQPLQSSNDSPNRDETSYLEAKKEFFSFEPLILTPSDYRFYISKIIL